MKVLFDVWINAKGEVHLTSDDNLPKPVNIRAKDGLESTRVLKEALLLDMEQKTQ